MPTIGIYTIISPSGKKYIGKSINIERRFKEYARLDCESQPKLYRSLKKYGWDAHEKHIFEVNEKQLDNTEKYFISWYVTIPHGLNCLKGGNGCRRTTEEQRNRMSKAGIGRVFSQESRDKKSKSLMGHSVSNEVKEKLRIARSKPVIQYSTNGDFINEYPSAKAAKIATGIFNISNCASNTPGYYTAGGYVWKYK